jgi:hypothetical protein
MHQHEARRRPAQTTTRALALWANDTLMARKFNNRMKEGTGRARDTRPDLHEPSWSG